MEYRIVNRAGQTIWVETRAKALLGDNPTLLGVMLDVTERKQTEADKALVTREISHRFKNSMAMVQSIANQTLRNANSSEQASQLFNERLHALARRMTCCCKMTGVVQPLRRSPIPHWLRSTELLAIASA